MNALYRLYLETVLWTLWFFRRLISVDGRLYIFLNAPVFQPWLASVGRMRARAAFIKASTVCPAYAEFLKAEGYRPGSKWLLSDVPVMNKENYVKRYSIEQRCYGGAIPRSGVVIDESSGSTGQPNNWVRSAAERSDVKRILQLNYQLVFRDSGKILLNCFALGPWATGMNVSMSLVDVGIMKSIGPDRSKLVNTLKLLGPGYQYLIFGYPPFIRSFVDECELDLRAYHIDFIVGGEGLSEGLRSYLLQKAKTVISSYGASDLEINIGVETPTTIGLRRLMLERPALCREVFGRDTPPMIFQYNALDYVIETNPDGELLVTIGRQSGAAPKIRYNIRDSGGTYAFRTLARRLAAHGVDLAGLSPRTSHFPILFVYGRNDSSVPFYGSKVFPSDIEQILSGSALLQSVISTFQLATTEDEHLMSFLHIHLERASGQNPASVDEALLHAELFEGLKRVNQDFREISRLFDSAQVRVHLHEHDTGPFAGRDIRIKNRYIA
jgi:phenylacetate-CoA ligase